MSTERAAHRARLGTDSGRAALLAVAERAEHAAVALRQAVTLGQDHDAAAAELLAAAAALARMRDCSHGNPPSPEGAAAIQHGLLPNSVTHASAPPHAPAPTSHRPPVGPAQRASVTEQVTKQAVRQPITQQRRPQPIDPDTVRLERSADYDLTGTWRVVAGPADDPILVGSVRRTGLSKQWEARTPALVAISGGPWRTRQHALVQLLQAALTQAQDTKKG